MSSVTWRYQAGETASFAITVPIVTNPTTATAETGVYKQIGFGPSRPTFGRIGNLALVSSNMDDGMVDADEGPSWGSIALWIRGINVCEHAAQGETLGAAHWYLLPVPRWFVENSEPLLHEERLPCQELDRQQLAASSESH